MVGIDNMIIAMDRTVIAIEITIMVKVVTEVLDRIAIIEITQIAQRIQQRTIQQQAI